MKLKKYSVIVIIYNPNSTGKSQRKATELERNLKKRLPTSKIRLRATQYAGHAESITYRTALTSRHALVISVSGDGGYNEVVNGAMRATRLAKKVTVGLLPAGNANDHYATRHRGDFVDRIATGDDDRSDVLRLRAGRVTRYGHSYIGLGLTPQASEKLNQTKLNAWEEAKIIGTVLLQLKSVKILVGGEIQHYNSLIFSIVSRMSKVIKVPGYSGLDDGQMDVSHIYHRNKIKLIADLAHAALFGLPVDEHAKTFEFETIRRTAVQIDGEVTKIEAGTLVTVDVVAHTLRVIV